MDRKVVLDTELIDQEGKRAITLRIKPLNKDYGITTSGFQEKNANSLHHR